MTIFKVKYKKNGKNVEVEVEIHLPFADKLLAAKELNLLPSQIISIKEK